MATKTPQTPSPAAFAAKFRTAIRVGFQWDRFFAENWPVELIEIDTREALARCYMPWYIGAAGEEVAYDHPEAAPMSLADVPKAVALLNEERRMDISKYVDEFRATDGAIEFEAPTYGMSGDRYFVLDRNHRLSALALSAEPFRVTLWNVRGPRHSGGLLDLVHFEPPKIENS